MTGRRDKEEEFMAMALGLARRGYGRTSPNPMVGAVLVRDGAVIGKGWHHRAGAPHAEIEAMRNAAKTGSSPSDAVLYVTLEPCSTFGRTPPCTQAILESRVRKVVVGAIDPNPNHAGRGLDLLRQAGMEVQTGVLAARCELLNEVFNHWIVRRTPFVILKSAMTMDGKIATRTGRSKWITGPQARSWGMNLRFGMDAILVGVGTVAADDPSLTCRGPGGENAPIQKTLRRFVLDPLARIPPASRLLNDDQKRFTTVVVGEKAPPGKVRRLKSAVTVWEAPSGPEGLDLSHILKRMGEEGIASLLVEGGGETHARFLERGLAQRVCLLFAPMIIGGRGAPKGVGGSGLPNGGLRLEGLVQRRLGPDLLLTGRVDNRAVSKLKL